MVGVSLAVTLADAHPFQRDERAFERCHELGQQLGDALAVADGDDHERDLCVAAEELRALTLTMHGPVHTEHHTVAPATPRR